ncbi:hypothetical protein NBRC10512_001754 [Rhodotorula toruloides]|uniref:RHTO0S07e01552g1_1 n=2 Tax=Rhodotorula toruloides TaxID=5286 RepID=A0A061B4L6_RHOTO|nr:uncharacterized protein RHTO_02733 [Rhodotorula toruloides NP11]EMS25007.1 hypothetical protein RHTO_02733 [Rhodotorula toruloides NP11]CDR42577.1 RHTO0S07e01552g1_1 [Rhodotorula toruloides]
MQSTHTALESAVKAAPRRRVRRAIDPSAAILPPSRDLIGPPCPLSNLRPVYYAPLFPSLHSPSGWSTAMTAPSSSSPAIPSRPHPYSLAEFPSSASSSHSNPRQARLHAVARSLHAKDLEWRLTRYRFDSFNQDFWARMNTLFLRARDEYIVRMERERAGLAAVRAAKEGDVDAESFPPQVSAAVAGTGTEDVDLAPFYAEYLGKTKRAYAEYNKQLWRMQIEMLWPAVKASARRWRWKWEVWRAGGEKL